MFLEFLSTQPAAPARKLLAQPVHILSALAERLRKRRSSYEAVFSALVALAAAKPSEDVSALLAAPIPMPATLWRSMPPGRTHRSNSVPEPETAARTI